MSLIRVADYIARFIEKELGVREVFLVSGGGMMFLSDGIALNPNLQAVCTHHEQAAAMAGCGYAKYRNDFSVVMLTTGCGGTNGITGLLNAYQDSARVFFISGQCKRKETVRNSGLPLRQFGVQEADIIAVVQSLTKYAVMVNVPEEISFHLEKAAWEATHGRPGPVWIDVPMDVQGAQVDESALVHFIPPETNTVAVPNGQDFDYLATALKNAKRPLIVAGQGVRLSGSIEAFKCFAEKHSIPFVASRLGIDLLPSDHPLFIGRIGNKGDRAGNFAVQNADLILVLGSRLSVSSTGHEYSTFGREAKIIVVDVDPVEHAKNTVRIDRLIVCDLGQFFARLPDLKTAPHDGWVSTCSRWKAEWPVCLPEYSDDSLGINLYYCVDRLSAVLNGKPAVVISDAGSAFYVTSQGIVLDQEHRYVTSGGQAEMGFSLPAAIGVAFAARKGTQIFAITGDGSLQMNIQELQTLKHYGVPVKLIVWNNDGYLSIRATQRKFFDGRYIGTDSTSGVSFPDLSAVAKAYGLRFIRVSHSADLSETFAGMLQMEEPIICEIMCMRDQEIVPTVSSKRLADGSMVSLPIEDMYPFLPRVKFKEEMIILPLETSNG
ncbi:MAG: thiamine pyrophosphate-binding protein [Kiritimatiellae bacterium]|nr:thiamine pyrophosphate-binding protein [Kiritimatiellia bacterium]